jgi:hypothetical protein
MLTIPAQEVERFEIPRPSAGALGGAHVAYDSGFAALFSNPAGLVGSEEEFSVSEITIRSTGPIFSIASLVSQTLDGEDFGTLLASPDVQQLLLNLYARLSIVGPISFGYVGEGVGFGLYNVTELVTQTSGIGGFEARLGQRIVLRGGYGLEIPLSVAPRSQLMAGISVKSFMRGDSVLASSLLGLPSFVGSLDGDTLGDSPFELSTGIGIGVGARYSWNDLVSAGLVIDNIYTPTAVLPYSSLDDFLDASTPAPTAVYDTLPQELTVGVAYTPTIPVVDRYVQDVTVLLDYRDALDFWLDTENAENFLLKFGLGVQFTLLEILDLRAGLSEGLFAAGFGLDLSVVEVHAAMYGSELSAEPGLRPVYNIVVGLEF